MTVSAGQFVHYENAKEEEVTAVVVRVSENHFDDGSVHEYVEVCELPTVLKRLEEVTPIGEPLHVPAPVVTDSVTDHATGFVEG